MKNMACGLRTRQGSLKLCRREPALPLRGMFLFVTYKFIFQTYYRSLMHLKPFSLLYCWVHKAASTSWNKIFLKLAGKKVPDKSIHEVKLRG